MLNLVNMKIKGTRLEQIVEIHKCEEDRLGLSDKVDFVFAFYMVHEVPDQLRLFKELKNILNPDGKLFIIEPRFHVSEKPFNEMINQLISNGFETISRPKVFFSRSVVVKLNSLHQSSA
jgi:SAM-dependent methyltransferase